MPIYGPYAIRTASNLEYGRDEVHKSKRPGTKQLENLSSGERGNLLTLVLAVSAASVAIPPISISLSWGMGGGGGLLRHSCASGPAASYTKTKPFQLFRAFAELSSNANSTKFQIWHHISPPIIILSFRKLSSHLYPKLLPQFFFFLFTY